MLMGSSSFNIVESESVILSLVSSYNWCVLVEVLDSLCGLHAIYRIVLAMDIVLTRLDSWQLSHKY